MALKMGQFVAGGGVAPGQVSPRMRVPSVGEFMENSGGGAELARVVGDITSDYVQEKEREQEEQKKADDAAFVMERVTQFEDESREKQNEYLSRTGNNAKGVYKEAVGYADSATAKYTEGIEDPRLRTIIIDQISSRRKSMLNTVSTHARNQNNISMQNIQTARLSGLSQDFVTTASPEEEQDVLRNITLTTKALGAAQGKTEEETDIALSGQISKVFGAKVVNLAAQDPRRAMDYYKKNEGMILPSERAGLQSRIQGKIDEIDRKNQKILNDRRASLLSGSDDAFAYMIETGDSSSLNNISSSLRVIGFNEEADDVDLRVRAGSMAYEFVQRSGDRSFAERMSNVEMAFPVTGPENAADIVRARDMAKKSLQAQAKMFKDDPAGYVNKDIPQELSGPQRVKARLERQRQLGAGMQYTPSILTNDEKYALKQNWDGAEDARSKLDLLIGIDKEYGQYTAGIFSDMGFPPATFAALDIVTKDFAGEADAQLLINAATTKKDEIPKRADLSPADIQKAVEDSAVYGMYSKLARIAGADVTMQGSVRSLQDTIYKAVLITGDTSSAATLDKYYGVMNDDEHLITYDKSRVTDSGLLEDILSARKMQAKESVVRAIGPDAPGMLSKFFGASYDNNVVWIDANDGDGWVLFAKNSQTIVTDENGEMIRVFEEDVNPANPEVQEYRRQITETEDLF